MGAGYMSTKRNKRKSRGKVTASWLPIIASLIVATPPLPPPPPFPFPLLVFGVVASKRVA